MCSCGGVKLFTRFWQDHPSVPSPQRPSAGIFSVCICLVMPRVKCLWGPPLHHRWGLCPCRQWHLPSLPSCSSQAGYVTRTMNHEWSRQHLRAQPPSRVLCDGLVGRGGGAGSATCLQNHLSGPQRDTSKDFVRTGVLDGDHQCQPLLSVRRGPCTEGEYRGPELQARASLACPQRVSFSPDPGLSVPLAFDPCPPSSCILG